METVERGEEVNFDDISVSNNSSDSVIQEEIANPIVYKLVRVEGDGRLVPATDDEVMEVENLLDDDKSEMCFVADAGERAACTSNHDVTSDETILSSSKELENLKPDDGNSIRNTALDLVKSNIKLKEVSLLSTPSSDESPIGQSGGEECLEPSCAMIEGVASTSKPFSSRKPDFSRLKGEICLDNLSVKDLQETFKATFGRETSVKDKQWLKRRIAMGLSNSCDFSTSTFVIQGNRVVKKKVQDCKNIGVARAKEPLAEGQNDASGDLSTGHNNQTEDCMKVYGNNEQNVNLDKYVESEDSHGKQGAAKRVRKPTKRYIEEVSESDSREYSGKLLSPVKNPGYGQLSARSRSRPVHSIQSECRPFVTRQDSLGGSGVQVPYVSRIRRGRPRENIMALMKIQPSGMGMRARLVKKSLVECDQRSDHDVGNVVFKARLGPSGWVQKPVISKPEKDELYLEQKTTEPETDVESGHMDSSGDNSDDNIVTVPTSKGGMRRKHHRPWSLSEVVKLVEGVARYGAGRWSEIKRIAFASQSYRTSVDLKDKWRNLLRASFAQLPAEKGVQNSRKHAAMAIPSPILLRVRELAEMQSQVTPDLTSMKFIGHSGRSVHETRPGFL